jgi:iron(III) transport system ATP-binding protein
MTVAQNVGFGLEIRKVTGEERERRIREALDAVQMGQYAQRKPNQLSGGQQQRVALARALVIRPDVLLLDEPLSNLDAKLRNELRSEIRRICKSANITGVYVTHDQKEALSMADRVAVVNQGRIVQVAPPAEMYRRPRNKFVAEFLGETNLVQARLIERAPGAGGAGGAMGGGRVVVQTPIGRLISAAVSKDVDIERALDARGSDDQSGSVLVSVRPEAVHIGEPNGTNTLFGRVRESTYLGETAQLLAEIAPSAMSPASPTHPGALHAVGAGKSERGAEWKIATLNPGLRANVNETIALSVHPDDVVVLPVPG